MSGRHSGEDGTPDDELIPFTTESAPAGSADTQTTQPDHEIHHPEPPADTGAQESGPPPTTAEHSRAERGDGDLDRVHEGAGRPREGAGEGAPGGASDDADRQGSAPEGAGAAREGVGEGAPGGASDDAGRMGSASPGPGAGREGFPAKGVRRGRAARRAGLLAIGVTASIIALGAGGYTLLKPYLDPDDFEGRGSGTVTVHIPPGASAGDIGATLAGAGVVASARSFVNETQERAVAARLRPGHYRMRKGMAAGAALDLLLAPSSRVVRRVTVPEGMRASEALQRVAAQSGVPLKELQAADPALIGLPSYAPGLEGFLFPATYEVEPGDSAVDVLAAMVDRFGAAARKLRLAEGAARVGLTPLEAVTVASLVESEGGQESDYAKISRVIYNRLRSGTPLQLDATVTYAQHRRSLRVTEKDTKVRSPYNTYLHKGLPPGPIANPGEKALIAALRPADGDWHWFVTTDPAHRITKFTNKESEFVRYREELNRNLGTK